VCMMPRYPNRDGEEYTGHQMATVGRDDDDVTEGAASLERARAVEQELDAVALAQMQEDDSSLQDELALEAALTQAEADNEADELAAADAADAARADALAEDMALADDEVVLDRA
jgi:hypothetical protein